MHRERSLARTGRSTLGTHRRSSLWQGSVAWIQAGAVRRSLRRDSRVLSPAELSEVFGMARSPGLVAGADSTSGLHIITFNSRLPIPAMPL